MATPVFESANYVALEMRGGGFLIRSLYSSAEVFFQPGDDSQTIRETIEALEEVPESKQETIFDMVCSDYF